METRSINIQVNLNYLKHELALSLQRIITLAAAGLSRLDTLEDPSSLALPVNVTMVFARQEITSKQVKTEYERWILLNSFRDAIESFHLFLESVHQVLAIWSLIEDQTRGVQITSDLLNKVLDPGSGKFHRLGFPEKLNYFSGKFGIALEADTTMQLLSINAARNCMAHRNGIVGKKETGEEVTFEISWKKMRVFLKNEHGEEELVVGKILQHESSVGIEIVSQSKKFENQELLVFSVEELSEILWGLVLYGEELVSKVSIYGQSKGHVQSNDDRKEE